MSACSNVLRFLLSSSLLACLAFIPVTAGEISSSGFGAIAIPQPAKPDNASACVEPVDIMRREHMNLLLHQRDATVREGERDSRHSLAGCMDCHNPAASAETAIRYPDPEHFCAGCHLYASVKIDCFECHADRGLGKIEQGQFNISSEAPAGSGLMSLQTFQLQLEESGDD